ncbi:MAG: heat-inducible transcription repressor HrcA [Clostridia bacterium]|nr:heat-inducible transcription repressor HrcA [Clostridia bacterium]
MSANNNCKDGDIMQLSDRKRKILQAIIHDYIETAEPVGSRTICKNHISDLSPATIRNEMADLEEMGYLEQPHTSAGRIPSDLGYRVFVDSGLERYRLTIKEMLQMQEAFKHKMREANSIMSEISSILSQMTNYTAVATSKRASNIKIQSLQVMPIDARRILAMMITNDGGVKNQLIVTHKEIDGVRASEITAVLNSCFAGMTVSDITPEKLAEAGARFRGFAEIDDVFEFMLKSAAEIEKQEIIVDGSINMLSFPEYSDVNKAKRILEYINDKKSLNMLLQSPKRENEIEVIIGNENPLDEFKDCSIIMCSYNLGGRSGSIGLVGPRRMNYSKAISMMEYLKNELDNIISERTDEDE